MAEYLLSVHMVEGEPPPPTEVMHRMFAEVDRFNRKLQQAGAWVFAGGLQPVAASTVVRLEDGRVVASDGLLAPGPEQLGGFWVINVANLDAALVWAGEATAACGRPVEVRPFQTG